MLSIGLMSGTSMDGIDAALLETDGSHKLLNTLSHTSLNYDNETRRLLKAAEYTVRKVQGNLVQASQQFQTCLADYLTHHCHIPLSAVETEITQLKTYLESKLNKTFNLQAVFQHSMILHATVVKQLLEQTKIPSRQVAVVGYHGQTMLHRPQHKISIVVGDGQALADRIGITVVNDFRSRDIAAGGQGAPFAPLYHQALAIRDQKIPLAVVNCGGIANMTVILNNNPEDLIGFDTGPGNALLDQLIHQRTGAHLDHEGQHAKQATISNDTLAYFLELLYEKSLTKNNRNYFKCFPPKTLDYGDMELIAELDNLSTADACKVLACFTADSIVQSLDLIAHTSPSPKHWILSGGGWFNPVITEQFKTRLKQKLGSDVLIETADETGWHSQAMEAELFAFLAVRSLQGQVISFPSTTQVPTPLSGGVIYRPRFPS